MLVMTLAAALSAVNVGHAETRPKPIAKARAGEFSTLALITGDRDWLTKWNKPHQGVPAFKPIGELHVGEAATLLVFVTGLAERTGRLQAFCGFDIQRPDKTVTQVPEQLCYDQRSIGQRTNILLTDARIEFRIDADDLPGLWRFRVRVRDANSASRTDTQVGVLVVNGSRRP